MDQFINHDYLFYCYYQTNVFSPEECEILKNLKYEAVPAPVYTRDKKKVVDIQQRHCLIQQIPVLEETDWIFKRLHDIVLAANKKYYKFDANLLFPLQVIEYPVGGNYGRHVDIGTGIISNRKLSVIAFLSDYAEYEGGRLRMIQSTPFPQTQGTLIIFPSYIPHEVEPVIRGVRHTLVGWVCGPAFR